MTSSMTEFCARLLGRHFAQMRVHNTCRYHFKGGRRHAGGSGSQTTQVVAAAQVVRAALVAGQRIPRRKPRQGEVPPGARLQRRARRRQRGLQAVQQLGAQVLLPLVRLAASEGKRSRVNETTTLGKQADEELKGYYYP